MAVTDDGIWADWCAADLPEPPVAARVARVAHAEHRHAVIARERAAHREALKLRLRQPTVAGGGGHRRRQSREVPRRPALAEAGKRGRVVGEAAEPAPDLLARPRGESSGHCFRCSLQRSRHQRAPGRES